MRSLYVVCLVFCSVAWASSRSYNTQPYGEAVKRATVTTSLNDTLQVDLGYDVYQGYTNRTAGLNIYKGIRFASPPTGNLRFQLPRVPSTNRTGVITAEKYAPQCPQSPAAGLSALFPIDQSDASEDCLFLNVWTPSNATKLLPVYVWIHGGGYGQGNGRQDMTALLNTNGNNFVAVSIQYRLGAFGFLSSDEVYRKGFVNAGLYDQHLALHWVNQYIHLFNGDSTRVTISGESAGAGSVMLQDLAYGGTLGTNLFVNTIAASPYLPMQYGYKDWRPSQAYYAFATSAGCATYGLATANSTGYQPIFECLQGKDSETLINASVTVSQQSNYGTWGFVPVTDGTFVQELPSRQLSRQRVNGLNILSGNNANEGVAFTPQTITTEAALIEYLRSTFPLFSENDIAKILRYYPSPNVTDNASAPLFATAGDSGPTAINQSSLATGHQQRANNIYSETTFVCPSYWLAEAYSSNKNGGQAYKYQFSIPPALHASDLMGYYGPPGSFYSRDFTIAFQKIFGNFVVTGNPSISNEIAIGLSQANSTNTSVPNPASSWPAYSLSAPYQIDLNTTCPDVTLQFGRVQACNSSRAVNDFRLVDAYTWEGGRGVRCDFWKSMGELVPE